MDPVLKEIDKLEEEKYQKFIIERLMLEERVKYIIDLIAKTCDINREELSIFEVDLCSAIYALHYKKYLVTRLLINFNKDGQVCSVYPYSFDDPCLDRDFLKLGCGVMNEKLIPRKNLEIAISIGCIFNTKEDNKIRERNKKLDLAGMEYVSNYRKFLSEKLKNETK